MSAAGYFLNIMNSTTGQIETILRAKCCVWCCANSRMYTSLQLNMDIHGCWALAALWVEQTENEHLNNNMLIPRAEGIIAWNSKNREYEERNPSPRQSSCARKKRRKTFPIHFYGSANSENPEKSKWTCRERVDLMERKGHILNNSALSTSISERDASYCSTIWGSSPTSLQFYSRTNARICASLTRAQHVDACSRRPITGQRSRYRESSVVSLQSRNCKQTSDLLSQSIDSCIVRCKDAARKYISRDIFVSKVILRLVAVDEFTFVHVA